VPCMLPSRVVPNAPDDGQNGWNEQQPEGADINEHAEEHGCGWEEALLNFVSSESVEIVAPDIWIEAHGKRTCGNDGRCSPSKDEKPAAVNAVDQKHCPEDEKQVRLDCHEQQRRAGEKWMAPVKAQKER